MIPSYALAAAPLSAPGSLALESSLTDTSALYLAALAALALAGLIARVLIGGSL